MLGTYTSLEPLESGERDEGRVEISKEEEEREQETLQREQKKVQPNLWKTSLTNLIQVYVRQNLILPFF